MAGIYSALLVDSSCIILGDLNVGLKSSRSRGVEHFQRILQKGWHRAIPGAGASFISDKGLQSEIDHILGTELCSFEKARYVTECAGYQLAGTKEAISDHAALISEVYVTSIT